MPKPVAAAEPRARQDHHYGDARSQGRRIRQLHAAPRQGQPGGARRVVAGVKYFHLIWSAMFRRQTRTIFTLLSVLAAFLLFGLLDSVRSAFANAGAGVAGVDRLGTVSKISFTLSLPKSLLARIEAVPGVAKVTYANWFGGGVHGPHKHFFQQRGGEEEVGGR